LYISSLYQQCDNSCKWDMAVLKGTVCWYVCTCKQCVMNHGGHSAVSASNYLHWAKHRQHVLRRSFCVTSFIGFWLHRRVLPWEANSRFSCWWGKTMSLNCGHQRAYCSSPRLYMSMEATVEWYWQGKPKNSEINLSQYTLFTIHPTWTDPRANPGLRRERPAANRLSHGIMARPWR
jgi:hypothetical protein